MWDIIRGSPIVKRVTTTTITLPPFVITHAQVTTTKYINYIPGTGIKIFHSVTNKIQENFDR